MKPGKLASFALIACAVAAGPATAQEAGETAGDTDADNSVEVLFATGKATLGQEQRQQLDRAARVFRDGNPTVMIVRGSADTVGDAGYNLDLSIRRARAVTEGLVRRGIPVDRLQVLGQGNSNLPVRTEDEVPNPENRSVSITWQ